MKKISFLTYNLLHGRAFKGLIELLKDSRPDLICLQEFQCTEGALHDLASRGYRLADYAHSFYKVLKSRFFGIATFYNPQKLDFKSSAVLELSRGIYESVMWLAKLDTTRRTVLNSIFSLKENGKIFQLSHLHLTPLYATNLLRKKQIRMTLADLQKNAPPETLVIGDFNYFYRTGQLIKLFAKAGFQEATDSLDYTYEYKIMGRFPIRAKTDYFFFRGLQKPLVQRMEPFTSDHFPIYGELSVEA